MKKIIAALLGAVMTIAGVAPASFAMNANFVKKSDFYINDGRETNIRTIFKPTDDTADKQNNIFDEETVKVEGTKSIKFAFENAVAGKTADINHKQGVDISSVKKSGYICFDMYIETEIEDELYPQIIISDNTTNGTGSTPVSLTGLSYNEWNEVSVKLSDFGTSINDFDILKQVSLTLSEAVDGKYNVYLQSIAVYEEPVLEITESSWKDETVSLSWEYSVTASKYEIYLNGTLAGTSVGKTFTCEYNGTDATITLQVKALDENDEVIAKSEEAACAFTDIYSKKILSYYENTSTSNARNTWTVEKDSAAPLGGHKLVTDNIKSIIDGPGETNISDYVSNGYLGFYLRSETDEPWQIELSNGNDNGWKRSRYTLSSSDITEGKWQFVKINLADFIAETDFDYSDVELIVFLQDVTCKKEIQGLAIYKTIAKPEASITENGINEDGKSYVKLSFTDKMPESAIVKGNFTIEGMTCTGAELMPDEKTAVLTFDTVFEFPKTYELVISKSVLNTDGLSLSENKLKFTTDEAHKQITANVNTPQVSGRTVTCTASAKAIYSSDGGEQDITMLMVVYSGQKIIDVDYDSKTDVAALAEPDFRCTAEIDDEYDISEIRTEVYFINNLTEGRPLCESKAF